MELTEHSKNKFKKSMADWGVQSPDYFDPVYNYLVYGFNPGSFFTSFMANDATMMLARSHPANSLKELIALSKWVLNHLVGTPAFGSYEKVELWCSLDSEKRREILETKGLIFTDAQEVMLILKGTSTHSPFFEDNI
jgi:hypothetical protein